MKPRRGNNGILPVPTASGEGTPFAGPSPDPRSTPRPRLYVVLCVFFWTLLLGFFLAWDINHFREDTRRFALNEARANFNKDEAFRSWALSHGGVYVTVNEQTRPNPKLAHLPERDIVTPSGKELTLMSHASMVRQFMEQYSGQYGVRGHITSLDPLWEGNGPDEWETGALKALGDGREEFYEFTSIGRKPYLRYMRPMVVKKNCIECHGVRGYREGDLRGGVAFAVSLAPLLGMEGQHTNGNLLTHGFIWILGVIGIVFFSHRINIGMAGRRKAEFFIKNILESVGEAMIVIDRDYRIISANRAFSEQTGRPLKDVMGAHCYEVTHDIRRPCHEHGEECPIKDTFEKGVARRVVHTHLDADGNPTFVEIHSYPMKDASGVVVSAIELINDITEKRKIEDRLRQTQKMEALGTFTGGIAHDFNNMLTTILGYSEFLKDELADDDPKRHYLDEIMSAGEKAAMLTQGLLSFGRKQMMHPKALDINAILETTAKMLTRLIGENIEIVLDLEEGPLVVMADAVQIEQVLMNLATNARDAMPQGGQFILHTERIEIDEEFATTHGFQRAGRYLLFAATDTGTGMDETTREQIFEPFFTTKQIGRGTGLGLSVVYGIVRQHEGQVSVYSEPGKGTTFKIYLPLVTHTAEEKEYRVIESAPGGNETVLIAEDDDSIRRLLVQVLQGKGYTTIEARNGEEAVVAFTDNSDRVDLVILDVVMPKMGGFDAVEIIRATKPDVKVLFMSGYPANVASVSAAISEYDLLQKPLSPREVLGRVRSLIDA